MAGKKPLRISDDTNDLQTAEFGETELAALGGLSLNPNMTAPAYDEGQSYYDNVNKTLAIQNDVAGATMPVGQRGYIRVYNNSGSTISKGKICYTTGYETTENRPTIALARADLAATSYVIGVAAHSIANGTYGYVAQWGVIDDIDTSGFSSAQLLYLSPTVAGNFTNVLPIGSNQAIQCGYAAKINASTGSVIVMIRGIADKGINRPIIVLSFQSSSRPYISSNSSSYRIISYFEYDGSDNVFTPVKIQAVLARSNAGSTAKCRIYDSTNAQVIAEVTGLVLSTTFQIYDLGVVSNVPTGPAVWEFQIEKTSGGGSIWVAGCSLR